MNSFAMVWKRVVVLILLSMVGVGLAAGLVWWGANTTIPSTNSLNPDQFQEFGFEELQVEKVSSASGLNIYQISFGFEPTKNAESVSFVGFGALNDGIQKRTSLSPGFYNVEGTAVVEGNPLRFFFESFNPSDYSTGVFSEAYTTFQDLLKVPLLDTADYMSEVQSDGSRLVTVTGYMDGFYDPLTLTNVWAGMLETLPVSELTTYNLNLTSGQVSYQGTFNNEAEKNALSTVGSPIWSTSAAYADPNGVFREYDVQHVDVYLVPLKETNNHVISVTVTDPANKAEFMNEFEKTAQTSSKVSWKNSYYTTFTALEGSNPFWTVTPSNRIW